LTTDFFEFGTDKNGLDKLGMAVEMDDAVLGLACSTMASPPKWASVRNYSDPAINSNLAMRAEENCAAGIYRRYGILDDVMSAWQRGASSRAWNESLSRGVDYRKDGGPWNEFSETRAHR